MKKILIASNIQFGYLTDTLKYCEYLGESYEIEVVCGDDKEERIIDKNIKVHYLTETKKFRKRAEFVKIIKEITANSKVDIIFVDYFYGCSIINFFFGKKYPCNVDIRTGAVSKDKIKRKIKNLILSFECNRFSNISIISKGLQKKLHISKKKAHHLPLGADINLRVKDTESKIENGKNINLVYVGALGGRNIDQTILGIKYYLDKYPSNQINISYDIIGYSANSDDEELIKKYIDEFKLKDQIKFHGRLEYKKALAFVAKSNIGISYIPITEYYNFQPPTKTFEYLLSGIPTLATQTFENAQIINKTNGVLTQDTPESFGEGLNKIILQYQNYNADEIIGSVKDYTWDNIITNNLEPYLISISKK